MRVGIIGGTFNPIHFGHLRMAEEVRETLCLDKVVFIPTCMTPLKEGTDISADDRLEMTELAIKGNPGFAASDIEIKRGGRSYTYDTLMGLGKAHPEFKELHLIIGSDAFNEIASWYRSEELFRLADFVVVTRPGYQPKPLEEVLGVELAGKFWYDSTSNLFQSRFNKTVRYIQTTLLDISSSAIRRRIGEGRSVKYLLAPEVAHYIAEKGLYRHKKEG